MASRRRALDLPRKPADKESGRARSPTSLDRKRAPMVLAVSIALIIGLTGFHYIAPNHIAAARLGQRAPRILRSGIRWTIPLLTKTTHPITLETQTAPLRFLTTTPNNITTTYTGTVTYEIADHYDTTLLTAIHNTTTERTLRASVQGLLETTARNITATTSISTEQPADDAFAKHVITAALPTLNTWGYNITNLSLKTVHVDSAPVKLTKKDITSKPALAQVG
jgi:hypothetical protein